MKSHLLGKDFETGMENADQVLMARNLPMNFKFEIGDGECRLNHEHVQFYYLRTNKLQILPFKESAWNHLRQIEQMYFEQDRTEL